MMRGNSLSLVLLVAAVSAGGAWNLVACSEPTSARRTDAGDEDEDAGDKNDAGDEEEEAEEDAGRDASTSKDAGSDAKEEPQTATLVIDSAQYKNSTAAGGGYVYAVKFNLSNTSAHTVTSIDELEFDFGGDKVSLNDPLCNGSFAIAKGSKRLVDVQIVISTSGTVSNFAVICGASQLFGGAIGSAPATASFTSAIPIAVSGKLAGGGQFTASGSATRM